MVDYLDDVDLISEYADACNVDVEDMDKAIRRDPMAREQYLNWIQEQAIAHAEMVADRRFEGYNEQ